MIRAPSRLNCAKAISGLGSFSVAAETSNGFAFRADPDAVLLGNLSTVRIAPVRTSQTCAFVGLRGRDHLGPVTVERSGADLVWQLKYRVDLELTAC